MSKYQLIHIDTLEVIMCEKITIDNKVDNKDYYLSNDEILFGEYYISLENNYATKPKTRYVIYNRVVGLNGSNPKKIIATTNTSLECPQVIDYVEEIAKNDYYWRSNLEIFKDGYKKAIETHSLSDEELCYYYEWFLKNHEKYSSYNEMFEEYKKTLPIKVYYK